MFQVKICGITRSEDLGAVVDGGADAIGLNFVSSSPRCVSLELGNQLSRQADGKLLRVAVVKNPSSEELRSLVETVPLDALQFHGHESPDILQYCHGLAIIKAVSWSELAWEEEFIQRWRQSAGSALAAFLVDAAVPGAIGEIGGGSGRSANWNSLFPRPSVFGAVPLVLAGGLRPSNVVQAIRTSHCSGVDAASGVEQSPGIKDPQLVRQFTDLAKRELTGVAHLS